MILAVDWAVKPHTNKQNLLEFSYLWMGDYAKTWWEDGNLCTVKHRNKKSKNLSQHISEHWSAPVPYMSYLPDYLGASRKWSPTLALPRVRQNLLDVKIQKKKKK